jgi:hypothetical protein
VLVVTAVAPVLADVGFVVDSVFGELEWAEIIRRANVLGQAAAVNPPDRGLGGRTPPWL